MSSDRKASGRFWDTARQECGGLVYSLQANGVSASDESPTGTMHTVNFTVFVQSILSGSRLAAILFGISEARTMSLATLRAETCNGLELVVQCSASSCEAHTRNPMSGP